MADAGENSIFATVDLYGFIDANENENILWHLKKFTQWVSSWKLANSRDPLIDLDPLLC